MNPIIPGFNPDPSICRAGDDYYLATSTFEYFPGVPIYHSTDLVNWKIIGHALTRRSQLDLRCVEPGGGVWAPTLRYNKGRWYMATCVVYSRTQRPIQPQGFYVWTDNIRDETSWSDPIFFNQIGIDQDLFFDDDERTYLCTARFSRVGGRQAAGIKLAVHAVEIDLRTGRSLCAPVHLRSPPVKEVVSEGPHIIKRDGMYYLLTAEGGTGPGHHVIVSRSKSPLGPYELGPEGINPVIFNGDDTYIQRTGHADLVEGPDGQWWAVLLGIRPQEGGMFQLGRETFLVPVHWRDGWPVFNQGEKVGRQIPGLARKSIRETPWRDDFTSSTLSPGWYHVRTPIYPFHALSPGCLTLHGNPHTINQFECPAMLVRKQTSYAGTWRTELDFEPSGAYEEAGTAVYYSGKSYAAILLRQGRDQGMRIVVLRYTDPADRDVKEYQREVPAQGRITLVIKAQPKSYTFSYACDSPHTAAHINGVNGVNGATAAGETVIASLPSKVLDGGSDQEYEFYFTGAHFGLFAQGTDGEAASTPARFKYAEYIEEA